VAKRAGPRPRWSTKAIPEPLLLVAGDRHKMAELRERADETREVETWEELEKLSEGASCVFRPQDVPVWVCGRGLPSIEQSSPWLEADEVLIVGFTDRTGHKSASMVALYKRQARTWEELNLGELRPLDTLLPEMRAAAKGPSTPSTSGARRAVRRRRGNRLRFAARRRGQQTGSNVARAGALFPVRPHVPLVPREVQERQMTARWLASRQAASLQQRWPGPESNRRHADFQSAALPTELPGRPESGGNPPEHLGESMRRPR
jgi:hypothetical protein